MCMCVCECDNTMDSTLCTAHSTKNIPLSVAEATGTCL